MKLDYLKTGSGDSPLVRLYGFDPDEASRLRQAFSALAGGRVELAVSEWIESVDGCRITFSRAAQDHGVVEIGSHQFNVILTQEGWHQAADLVAPFCDGAVGYQWLTPQTRGIQLLFSKDGSW